MADYTGGGWARYFTDTGNFDITIGDGSAEVWSEDPTPDNMPPIGSENGIFEVGEETLDDGFDFNETYIGNATIDGHFMIVVSNSSGLQHFFLTPAGVDPSTVTWPANLSDITINAVNTVICFARATCIATPLGERPVESLSIGDQVLTACGQSASVKWIGRQTLHKLCHGPHMQLVRLRAGALGNGLPHSDLMVTADHGMVIDGLVINASALVNGTTIDWVPLDELEDIFTVYHIETKSHNVILANGAPAETFVDYVGRQAFDNYAEYLNLYGAERIIPEMERPRISARRMVPGEIKAKLGTVDEVVDFDQFLSA